MNKLEIVMYHYVRDLNNSRYPNIKGLDLQLFKQQVAYFEENYNFVSMDDVLSAIYEGKRLPDNAIMLSFDDGYSDHFTNVFPILANRNISGLFAMPGKILKENKALDVNKIHFILASAPLDNIKSRLLECLAEGRAMGYAIPTNDELYAKYAVANRFDCADTIFVKRVLQNGIEEKARNMIVDKLFREFVTENEAAFVSELYLSREQIKVMKKHGMTFGLHGYEHYWFDRLSEKEYIKDINMALDVFDGVIDHDRWVFCYPYGATQEGLINYCKGIGCVAGVTVEPAIADLDNVRPMLLPRYDTNDYPPKVEVARSRMN